MLGGFTWNDVIEMKKNILASGIVELIAICNCYLLIKMSTFSKITIKLLEFKGT